MTHALRTFWLGFVLVGALGAPRAADAQSANERSLARSQFRDGLEAAQGGDWESAFASFQSSYALVPRPITLLNLAGAMVQTGRLVEGAEAYRRFIREARSGREAAHADAARAALEELEGRIPVVELRVLGFTPGDVLSLDGWEVSEAVLEEELPVDPGEHQVTVDRQGHQQLVVSFEVREGATREVVVDATSAHWPSIDGASESGDGDPILGAGGGGRRGGDDAGESSSIFASPWFWIITGVVVAAAIAIPIVIVATSSERDPVMGNLPPFRVEID
jgi:hypothetical protein